MFSKADAGGHSCVHPIITVPPSRPPLSRYPTALLPGAAAAQHSLVSDQRHVVRRGALPGLSFPPAGLRGVSPLHEPRGRGAGLPHPPEAGRVWDLHDQHSG